MVVLINIECKHFSISAFIRAGNLPCRLSPRTYSGLRRSFASSSDDRSLWGPPLNVKQHVDPGRLDPNRFGARCPGYQPKMLNN